MKKGKRGRRLKGKDSPAASHSCFKEPPVAIESEAISLGWGLRINERVYQWRAESCVEEVGVCIRRQSFGLWWRGFARFPINTCLNKICIYVFEMATRNSKAFAHVLKLIWMISNVLEFDCVRLFCLFSTHQGWEGYIWAGPAWLFGVIRVMKLLDSNWLFQTFVSLLDCYKTETKEKRRIIRQALRILQLIIVLGEIHFESTHTIRTQD